MSVEKAQICRRGTGYFKINVIYAATHILLSVQLNETLLSQHNNGTC